MAAYSSFVEDLISDVSQLGNSLQQSSRTTVTKTWRKANKKIKRCLKTASNHKISPLRLIKALSAANKLQESDDVVKNPSQVEGTTQQLQVNSNAGQDISRPFGVHPTDVNPVVISGKQWQWSTDAVQGKGGVNNGCQQQKGPLSRNYCTHA